MLERFPPELLRTVLLLTLPAEAYSTYGERQALLLAFSIVCRRVCDVAQPLLWRVMRLKESRLPPLEEELELAKHVRVLQTATQPSLEQVVQVVKQLPGLQEIRLEHYLEDEVLTSEQLQAFSAVEHLTLHQTKLPSPSVFDLPNLISLTLLYNTYDEPRCSFSPSSFPRLRALHTNRPHKFSDLLNNLDMIQVPFVARVRLARLPNRTSSSPAELVTLFTAHLLDLAHDSTENRKASRVRVSHLQFNWCRSFDPTRVIGDDSFQTLRNAWEAASEYFSSVVLQSQPLRILYLPQQLPLWPLKEVRSTHTVDVRGRVSMQEEDDIELNRDFWEFAKEERRKKER